MSNYQPNSSGRRSGRGPRRNRDRDHDRGDDSRRPASASAPAPQKKSLLQKILGFFSGSKPVKSSGSPTRSHPAYTPRNASGNDTPRESRDSNRGPRENRDENRASTPRQARKPEAVEVTSPKLYVGNLSFDAGEGDLSELFNGVGAVKSAEVVSHKHTEKSKGFGFVTMSSIEEAKRAVEVLHDKDFMGRKLVVSGAKTPVERE